MNLIDEQLDLVYKLTERLNFAWKLNGVFIGLIIILAIIIINRSQEQERHK